MVYLRISQPFASKFAYSIVPSIEVSLSLAQNKYHVVHLVETNCADVTSSLFQTN